MKTASIALLGILVLLVVGAGAYMYMNGSQIKKSEYTVPSTMQQQNQTANPTSSTGETPTQKTYTMADVSTHDNKSDCWIVIEGKVYNVTTFIPNHPGGNDILKGCGKDATSLFMGEREHAENNAVSYLPQFQIGIIQ